MAQDVPPLSGGCHCGGLRVILHSTKAPEELPVRVCRCTFCTRVRPRYTTDPAGRVEVLAASEAELGRYRFGLGLADFLFCRRCSVFVGAYQPGEAPIAVVNLEVLGARDRFTNRAESFDFDTEDEPARLARRRRGWTPAALRFSS